MVKFEDKTLIALFDNLQKNDKKIFLLMGRNLDKAYSIEEIKLHCELSINDARRSLDRLEGGMIIINREKARTNQYSLSVNGLRLVEIIKEMRKKGNK